MNLSQINKFATAKYSTLLNANEFLQITNNTLTILDVHTGFCKYFHFLPQVPNGFYINPEIPTKTILTYPSKSNFNGDTLVVIDTYTGEVFRTINLQHPKDQFNIVSVGTNVYFTLKSNPNVVFFMPFSEGQIAQFDAQGRITHICANQQENQFVIIKGDREMMNLSCKDCSVLWRRPTEKPCFLKYVGEFLVMGLNGEIDLIRDNPNDPRILKTPHGTNPVDASEIVSATKDGVIFTNDTQSQVAIHTNISNLYSKESTVAIVSRHFTFIYEVNRMPLVSSLTLQPGMPFLDDNSSIESNIYFAVQSTLYEYSIESDSIAKFTTLQSGTIEKIAATIGAVSIIYKVGEERKIQTFITGTKQRDEVGIDVTTDKQGNTWILEKDCLLEFNKSGISILQKQKIDLPADHTYDRVIQIQDTVALYKTETGEALYLRGTNFTPFRLPSQLTIFKWPALCTADSIYMYQPEQQPADQSTVDDFLCIDQKVTSCVWFAWTLVAVYQNKVYAIGRNGKARVVEDLPNSAIAITAAVPGSYVFVTTLPQISVFTANRPIILDTIQNCPLLPLELSRYITFIPSQPIDPRALEGIDPLTAMSIFNKTEPAYINQFVIDTYAKFGRFEQLYKSAQQLHASKEILRSIAEKARQFGQFEIVRQIYEQLGENEKLLEIFVILRSIQNLKVLGTKPGMEPFIKILGFEPQAGEYEPLINLQLPRTKELIRSSVNFFLFFGDPLDQKELFPSSFDEISNFGYAWKQLTGEEADAVASSTTQNLLEEKKPEEDEQPKDIIFKEKPKEETPKISLTLAGEEFFKDDDDTPQNNAHELMSGIKIDTSIKRVPSEKKEIKLGFQLNIATPGQSTTRRRSGTTRAKKQASFDLDIGDLGQKRAQVAPITPVTPAIPEISNSADPTGSIPAFPSNDDNADNENEHQENQEQDQFNAPFQSSLFLDM